MERSWTVHPMVTLTNVMKLAQSSIKFQNTSNFTQVPKNVFIQLGSDRNFLVYEFTESEIKRPQLVVCDVLQEKVTIIGIGCSTERRQDEEVSDELVAHVVRHQRIWCFINALARSPKLHTHRQTGVVYGLML